MNDPLASAQRTFPSRIAAIDIARGGALIAMAIYHFTWDLEFFGYVERGMTAVGGWKLFARCIASSFLFLVGVSLFLAHRNGVRWPGFWKRWAMVAGAAAAISLGTWYATPDTFIFFGILHEIALASLLGLLFLRLPAALTLVIAAAVIAAPWFLRSALFDHPALWWVGLSVVNPRSNDYVPVFPWFGAVLVGIAAAKIGFAVNAFDRMRTWSSGSRARPLALLGQHSLAFYLIHQPVLIACLWALSQIAPPALETPEVQFREACEATCTQTRDEEFCARYCVCMLDRLESTGMLQSVMASQQSDEIDAALGDTIAQCTVDSETGAIQEPGGQ